MLQTVEFSDLFNLPLSEQAYVQYKQVQHIVQDLTLSSDEDLCHYIWNNGQYSSLKAYQVLMGSSQIPPYFNWLWTSTCQLKHEIFFWLLIKDRLNIRNLLRRKNCHLGDYTCVLCDQGTEETVHHLF